MIADALKARGIRVMHIMGANSVAEHPWTAPARVVAGKLTYSEPPSQAEMPEVDATAQGTGPTRI
jgi:hypothetical protein